MLSRQDLIGTADILSSVVEWAAALLEADAAEIYLYDAEQDRLVLALGHGFIERYTGVTLRPGEGLAGKVFLSGTPMIVPNYHSWNGHASAFESIPRESTQLQVPLRWQNQVIGVLGIDATAGVRAFGEDDIRLATVFSNLAAVAIANSRLYERLQQQAERQTQLLEQQVAERTSELADRALQLETSIRVSREISSILDRGELLSRMVGLIREAFDYYCVQAYLLDEGGSHLVLHGGSAGITAPTPSPHARLEIDSRSLNGSAVVSNSCILVNDVSRDPRYLPEATLPGTASELVVPLRIGGRILGTLDVQSDQPDAFTQQDASVLQGLADQVAIAIENAHLVAKSRELAVLEERNRLARELHDSVTQSLYSLTLFAEAGLQLIGRGNTERAQAHLARIGETAQQALREMRLQVYQLRPSTIERDGLAGALRRRLDTVEGRSGIEASLSVDENLAMPPDVEDGLYYIAQEALNNALKHSGATSASVRITADASRLSLVVSDNGRGFDPADVADGGGMGLNTMRERATSLGGEVDVRSSANQGTTVTVRIPLADRGGASVLSAK